MNLKTFRPFAFASLVLLHTLLLSHAQPATDTPSVGGPQPSAPIATTLSSPPATGSPSGTAPDMSAATPGAPVTFWLPSARPSGNEVNDKVWLTYYPPQPTASESAAGHGAPAVVLLHYLGSGNNVEMLDYARYLQPRGIAAAVVTLPYHMQRLSRGDNPIRHYVSDNPDVVIQAFDQCASDVSTVVTWLRQQPGIDPTRIGAAGISLGAIVTHLAMGRDERIGAGVAMLGGGNLIDVFQRGILTKLFTHSHATSISPEEEARLKGIDPLTYADQNRPRRVLMIQGARDLVIPPRDAEALWRALGKPPIQWIDTNHVALRFASHSAMDVATAYLQSVWDGHPLEGPDVPRLHVPTIKVGFLVGLDSLVTPAVQLQTFRLGTRHHMALFHADAGMSGRGPFIGVAGTVSQFVDIGIGRRLGGEHFRPYTSLHIVF